MTKERGEMRQIGDAVRDHVEKFPEIRDLEILCVVVRLASFTKAATELDILTSYISKRIGILERTLGCTLFYRAARLCCWKPLKRLKSGAWKGIVSLTTRPRAAMRCTIVLEFDNGDGSVLKRVEVMGFHRPVEDQTPGDVGLSLAEGKSLLNCVQQEFVVEKIERFCTSRRSCVDCGVRRRLHDSHYSELNTTLGKVSYCRERWMACNCGADGLRSVSPLKDYLTEAGTGELRWLHAKLGATMPYRQARRVMDLLLPSSAATIM